jgi:hypothetical protein
MYLLVPSAAGDNGDGFGTLLAFEPNGKPPGIFIVDDRVLPIREALPSIQRKTCSF